jgi:hypothetical protein
MEIGSQLALDWRGQKTEEGGDSEPARLKGGAGPGALPHIEEVGARNGEFTAVNL